MRPTLAAYLPSRPALLAAAVAAAALAAALLPLLVPGDGLTVAALVCIGLCLLPIGWERLRTGDWLNGATFLLLPVALGFGLRGLSFLAGGTLTYPPFVSAVERDTLATRALFTATAAALAAYAGYRLGESAGRAGAGTRSPRAIVAARARRATVVLLAVGLLGYALLVRALGGLDYFRDISSARLDTAGLGVAKLAAQGAWLALLVWIATAERVPARRLLLATAGVLALSTGQRSAVFATVLTVLVLYHERVRPLPRRAALLALLVLALATVGLVEYREYTRSEAARVRTVAGVRVTRRPPPAQSTSVFRTALVSLDGLVLAQQAVPRDRPPSYGADLALAVEGFVPRRLWPEKPDFLAVRLARSYVGGARRGGVFLSGPGTLWAAGLWPGLLAGSLLLGAGVGAAYGRMRAARSAPWTLLYALAAFGAARFQLAGDASSLLFFLEALLPMLAVLAYVTGPAPPAGTGAPLSPPAPAAPRSVATSAPVSSRHAPGSSPSTPRPA